MGSWRSELVVCWLSWLELVRVQSKSWFEFSQRLNKNQHKKQPTTNRSRSVGVKRQRRFTKLPPSSKLKNKGFWCLFSRANTSNSPRTKRRTNSETSQKRITRQSSSPLVSESSKNQLKEEASVGPRFVQRTNSRALIHSRNQFFEPTLPTSMIWPKNQLEHQNPNLPLGAKESD